MFWKPSEEQKSRRELSAGSSAAAKSSTTWERAAFKGGESRNFIRLGSRENREKNWSSEQNNSAKQLYFKGKEKSWIMPGGLRRVK